ncbi:NAD(P)/FAD-dependent oxidoreductase [Streptomyces carpaticus]|uniref:NAD(P)/FAD-dependent oxidoreductase n=1 Tax=Streptomyces carpaticus TaxID=285558 RepID=UPI0031FA3DB9
MTDWTVRVRGDHRTKEVLRVERFLQLNDIEYQLGQPLDEAKVAVELLESGEVRKTLTGDGVIAELTRELGLSTRREQQKYYDLIVVGGGPAGMSAALNARTLYKWETLIVENSAPGGTAGTVLNPIDNYLGVFPEDKGGEGPLGIELAHTWMRQINYWGIQWLPGYEVTALAPAEEDRRDPETPASLYAAYRLTLTSRDGRISEELYAGMILIATGRKPRLLNCPGEDTYLGRGIYYGALYADVERAAEPGVIGIVGGGDTAAVAATEFAERKEKLGDSYHQVVMFVRSHLAKDMVQANLDNVRKYIDRGVITVHEGTSVYECVGYEGRFDGVRYGNSDGKTPEDLLEPCSLSSLYVLIGADPDLGWLDGIEGVTLRDGYVETTGTGLTFTGAPGIHAAGDIRYGSTRRISAAVGEGGAGAIEMHERLKTVWKTAIKPGTSMYAYYEALANEKAEH